MNWYRLLLRAYPWAFRERFGRDLEELFADIYRTPHGRAVAPPAGIVLVPHRT